MRVSEICERIGIAPRHLTRRFGRSVGIGPKFFGQILQINHVVSLLYEKNGESLAQIAQAAGFYDQAHFNHAMRRFFSEGVKDFLGSDHVAFETFIGASRRFGPTAARRESEAGGTL